MKGVPIYIMIAAVAALVLWRRTRSMYRPVRGNGARILVPLLFMIPAVTLLFNQDVNEPVWAFAAAFGLGILFSIPLIWTTNYEVRADDQIYTQKNWGFIVAFAGVVIIRFVLRQQFSGMDPQNVMALFVMVAMGYLIPWRIVSFIKFRRLIKERTPAEVN